MYTFKEISDKNGGLYFILKDDVTVAYIRIKFGIVNLYPVVDNDICWGICLDSWIFDDIEKTELTDEESEKIKDECQKYVDEFWSELENEDEDQELETYDSDKN